MSRSILVVEDSEDNRVLVGDLLRFHGWSVREAISGPQAVALALVEDFEAILMDLTLPGTMDGWAAARCIKQQRGVPIIALTAHAGADAAERALEGGFDGYLTKPIDVRRFLSQVEEVIALARS